MNMMAIRSPLGPHWDLYFDYYGELHPGITTDVSFLLAISSYLQPSIFGSKLSLSISPSEALFEYPATTLALNSLGTLLEKSVISCSLSLQGLRFISSLFTSLSSYLQVLPGVSSLLLLTRDTSLDLNTETFSLLDLFPSEVLRLGVFSYSSLESEINLLLKLIPYLSGKEELDVTLLILLNSRLLTMLEFFVAESIKSNLDLNLVQGISGEVSLRMQTRLLQLILLSETLHLRSLISGSLTLPPPRYPVVYDFVGSAWILRRSFWHTYQQGWIDKDNIDETTYKRVGLRYPEGYEKLDRREKRKEIRIKTRRKKELSLEELNELL